MPIKVKYSDELYHHGILGQKWGVRRFQNPDGSYTPEGLKRYGRISDKASKPFSKSTLKKIGEVRAEYKTSPTSRYHKMLALSGVKDANIRDIREGFYKRLKDAESIAKKGLETPKMSDKEWKDCLLVSSIADSISVEGDEQCGFEFAHNVRYALDSGGFSDEDDVNPFAYYAYKHNTASHYQELLNKYEDMTSHDKLTNALDSRLMDLGVNGGKKTMVPMPWGKEISLGENLALEIEKMADDAYYSYGKNSDVTNGWLALNDYAWGTDKTVQKFFNEAENYANKIKIRDINKLKNMEPAMDAVGIAGKSVKDFTDSDWKKFNEALSKM